MYENKVKVTKNSDYIRMTIYYDDNRYNETSLNNGEFVT